MNIDKVKKVKVYNILQLCIHGFYLVVLSN